MPMTFTLQDQPFELKSEMTLHHSNSPSKYPQIPHGTPLRKFHGSR